MFHIVTLCVYFRCKFVDYVKGTVIHDKTTVITMPE